MSTVPVTNRWSMRPIQEVKKLLQRYVDAGVGGHITTFDAEVVLNELARLEAEANERRSEGRDTA